MSVKTNHLRTGKLFRVIRQTAYGFVLAMSVIFSGCANDDDNCRSCATGIVITPSIAGGRITGSNFDPGDAIGMFVAEPTGIPDPDNYAYNIKYTFDGARWTAPWGSPLAWPGTGRIDVYGYWPYDSAISTGDPRRYPFTTSTDQTTRENYILNDFIWARAGRQLPGNPVPLLFSHSMARVSVNVVSSFDAGENWPQGAEVALIGLSRETTIDLSDGVADWDGARNSIKDQDEIFINGVAFTGNIELPREEDDVLPLVLDTPVSGFDLSVAAIVVPQFYSAGIPLVRITLDGEEYIYSPIAGGAFLPGVNVTVNLTLTDQPPGLVADLDQIDWEQSRVWNVYDGETVVAQVCRELIQPTLSTGIQAVVVYPVNAGNIDFSAGYVARVYRWNINEASRYEVDPRNIHGGSVNFTTSVSYTQGTLPAVRKVVVDQSSGITGTYYEAPVSLTVSPVTVKDHDGNGYPLVKINRWYWTALNLRTTHYRNGDSLIAWPYGGDNANLDTYGLLYSGYTAYDPRGLMPNPWHVPLEAESDAMHSYLQSQNGRRIKANRLWQSLDRSNDISGFSMLPGGVRNGNGTYSQIGIAAYWWTDTYNGFEGVYYTVSSEEETITKDEVTHEYAMSLRFVLTDPSALMRDQ